MYGATDLINSLLGSYHMADVSMRYSRFMPRFYNLAISLGFGIAWATVLNLIYVPLLYAVIYKIKEPKKLLY